MFSLIVIGQTYIPSGLASILNATTPLFTVLVMAAAGDEKLHPRRVAGVVTGLIGVIILHGQDLHGQDLLGTDLHGQDLGIQAGEGIGILLCLAAGQLPMPGATTWLAMMGLAGLSTALAYIVFFQVLRRSGSTNVMLVTLLIPVTAILLGYLVLGESISLREIVGALVIGSALLLIDGRVLNFVRRVPAIR